MDTDFTFMLPITGLLFAALSIVLVRKKFNSNIELNLSGVDTTLKATFRRKRMIPYAILGVGASLWIFWQLWSISSGYGDEFRPYFAIVGMLFMLQFGLAISDGVKKAKKKEIKDFETAIIIPVYNETPETLQSGIESLFNQTILPKEIHITDDGSTEDYTEIKNWFLKESKKKKIEASWNVLEENAGKREAQAVAINAIKKRDNDTTIIVTMDSDGVLDPRAIEEGLKPFADKEVQSVAGIVVAKNVKQNVLSRFVDVIFVAYQQLVDRAAMSKLGNVIVNCGGLAFYRLAAVEDALKNDYTNEMFFSRGVQFSDDSYLTLFALLRGKTVQQPSSIVFADMPVNLSHHYRQQIRWMRGSFIRSWWRLRYLPVDSWAFFRQALGWFMLMTSTILIVLLGVVVPLQENIAPPVELLLVPIAFGYLVGSRYFAIKRSDVSTLSQIGIFILIPLAAFWSLIVLRAIRIWGMLTCLKTGSWGTRQKVEIPSEE